MHKTSVWGGGVEGAVGGGGWQGRGAEELCEWGGGGRGMVGGGGG